jgi:hypothetical protein
MTVAPVRKVFIGCTDIASLIHDFTVGFRANGVDVFSMVFERAPIQWGRCDVEVGELAPPPQPGAPQAEVQAWWQHRTAVVQAAWNRAVEECDTFLFIWNSFRDDYADILELKRRGKRVVWWFMGSDCRWKPAYDQDVARYGLAPLHYDDSRTEADLLPRMLRLRTAEALADIVVNTPSQCSMAVRPYYDGLHSPVDISRYPHAPAQRERPVLLHAPSNAERKGTSHILATFEALRAEGLAFDVQLLDRLPHEQALQVYAEVDVLVGQIGALALGKQDRELMACGKVVVGGPSADTYPQHWPASCPAVPAMRTEELHNALRAIVPDVARRRELAARGRAHIATRHDPARTIARLIDAIEGRLPPDFTPDFFRDHFVPESPEMAAVHNMGLNLVQQAPWYRQQIAPGERDGLLF